MGSGTFFSASFVAACGKTGRSKFVKRPSNSITQEEKAFWVMFHKRSLRNARVFHVEGVSCDHCKHAIEEALSEIEGVDKVNVDVKRKDVRVVGSVSQEKVYKVLIETGYPPEWNS